jgi:hypothetical protein
MDPSDGQNYAAKHLPVSSKHGVRAFFADMIKALKACWAKPRENGLIPLPAPEKGPGGLFEIF